MKKLTYLMKEAENKKMLIIDLEDQMIIDENNNIKDI